MLEVIKDGRKDGGALICCSMTELVLTVLLLMKQVRSTVFIDNLVLYVSSKLSSILCSRSYYENGSTTELGISSHSLSF